MIARLWRLYHADCDQRDLEILRFALGSISLFWIFAGLANWSRDYSTDGLLNFYYNDILSPPWYWRMWKSIPHFHWILLVLGLVANSFFLLGIRARFFSLALYLFHLTLSRFDSFAMNTEQAVFQWSFLIGTFIPWGEMWTITHRHASESIRHSWALRILQLQVALVYLITAIYKVSVDPAWLDGTGVYWVLSDLIWSRFENPVWAAVFPVSESLTYLTLAVEFTFPFLIWRRATRLNLTRAMIGFHISLFLFMKGIAFFSFSMMAVLLAFHTVHASEKRA